MRLKCETIGCRSLLPLFRPTVSALFDPENQQNQYGATLTRHTMI